MAALIIAIAVLGLATSAAQAQEAVLTISYGEVHERILPTPGTTQTNVQLLVTLTRGGVQHGETRQSGRGGGGGSAQLKLGSGAREGWRVAGPNKLINIREYESYRRAIMVTVSGQSCSVQIGYNLKPGFKEYHYQRLTTGEKAVARSISAASPTCSIR
jgi:hypothetical protein